MEKLVRDKIVDEMKKQGKKPKYRVLNQKEYIKALKEKLKEESQELVEARPKHMIEELADVYEVFKTILKVHKIKLKEVKKSARQKKKNKGAFKKKISLDLKNIKK